MSPQSGLPHNNRVGDFDVFALPVLLRETGKTLDEVLDDLANQSGLDGLSGAGNDLRDIEAAADGGRRPGDARPRRLRRLGPPLPRRLPRRAGRGRRDRLHRRHRRELGPHPRRASAADLDWFGIELDPATQRRRATAERQVSADGLRVAGLDHADQRGDRRRPPDPRPPGSDGEA